MSLFKARDWWSTWAGSEEDFDLGCLCVANIDNDSSPSGKDAEKADIDFVQLVYFVLFQCSTMLISIKESNDRLIYVVVFMSQCLFYVVSSIYNKMNKNLCFMKL
jgi:hypothetical protein